MVNLAPPQPTSTEAHFGQIWSAEEEAFVRWLFRQASLDAQQYRSETLRRRLPACLRSLRVSTLAEARQLLQRTPSLIHQAINSLVIGVTSFFRDAPVFDYLTYVALPWLAKARGGGRIWSAGCSDGEEIYSLAMLLAEMNMLDGTYLLGTDCRLGAIDRAREGIYNTRSLHDVPQEWVSKYFSGEGSQRRVSSRLRTAVQWRTADVTRQPEPGRWNLILCRNMAMYLRSEVSGRLWEMMENSLRPGGFLVLGKAERPMGTSRLLPVAPCIYRRE